LLKWFRLFAFRTRTPLGLPSESSLLNLAFSVCTTQRVTRELSFRRPSVPHFAYLYALPESLQIPACFPLRSPPCHPPPRASGPTTTPTSSASST